MEHKDKTKEQLINELVEMRQRIIRLEKSEIERKRAEEELRKHREQLEELVEDRTSELKNINEQLKHEITKRKRVEETLRESEERYRALFQYSGTAIIIIEEDTNISMVNKRFEELSGYPKDEIEGKRTFVDFLPEKEKKRLMSYHEARRKGETVPTSYKTEAKRKDGEIRTILVSMALIPGTTRSIAALSILPRSRR